MSGAVDAGLRSGSSAAHLPNWTGRRLSGRSRTASAIFPTPAPVDALPRRTAGTRGRHAPLLRSRIDGASLEVRVPFLDHQVVELCAAMPADLKVRRLETKHVLRQAARGLVPDRIIDKPKIGFFNVRSTVGSARRRGARSATTSSARTRATRRCSIAARSSGSSAPGRRATRATRTLLSVLMLEVWLATYLPARSGDLGAAPARSPPERCFATPRSRRHATRRTISAARCEPACAVGPARALAGRRQRVPGRHARHRSRA